MIYLGWYDDNPKKSAASRIDEAIERYQYRYGIVPNVCLVSERETVEHSVLELRRVSHLRPNYYYIGHDEAISPAVPVTAGNAEQVATKPTSTTKVAKAKAAPTLVVEPVAVEPVKVAKMAKAKAAPILEPVLEPVAVEPVKVAKAAKAKAAPTPIVEPVLEPVKLAKKKAAPAPEPVLEPGALEPVKVAKVAKAKATPAPVEEAPLSLPASTVAKLKRARQQAAPEPVAPVSLPEVGKRIRKSAANAAESLQPRLLPAALTEAKPAKRTRKAA